MTDDPPKRRGRPRLMPAETMRSYRAISRDIHTDRQHQNRSYAYRAMSILGLLPTRNTEDDPMPLATWLADWHGANRGKQGAVKWSVLEQLGRMSAAGMDDASIRNLAAVIEENRWTAKDAAERLRRARLAPP